jgi:hypothetical protein
VEYLILEDKEIQKNKRRKQKKKQAQETVPGLAGCGGQ